MTELKLDRATTTSQPATKQVGANPRTAVERSIPLLRTSATRMLSDGGCVACHAQPVTQMAVKLAHDRGWNVPEAFASESLQTLQKLWMNADLPLLQGQEGGGSPDTLLYNAMALSSAGAPASWNTDVLVHYLIAKQRAQGNWHGVGASRAPIQDGDFSRTAIGIRVLKTYGIPARTVEIDSGIQRAANWLAAQTPLSTEDRVMQLLGLKWSNQHARVRETRLRELIGRQRPDGGWPQTPYLFSDAYATGQVLYTLHELGLTATDPAFRRGVEYLVTTQKDDGSWFVKSRAMKIQPYFESGFPYDHDQWISSAATAWAAMALSLSAR